MFSESAADLYFDKGSGMVYILDLRGGTLVIANLGALMGNNPAET